MKLYREVVRPPLTLMLFLIVMYFSLALAVWAAFDFFQALATFLILLLTLPFIWRAQRMVITVDEELYVDRAHIELKYLRDARALSAAEYRELRTFKSDARAFHATRSWLKRGVQVYVNDERDQTTYWLIGSNNPEALAEKLN